MLYTQDRWLLVAQQIKDLYEYSLINTIVNSFNYDMQMMFFILVLGFRFFSLQIYNVLDSRFYLFVFYFVESFI